MCQVDQADKETLDIINGYHTLVNKGAWIEELSLTDMSDQYNQYNWETGNNTVHIQYSAMETQCNGFNPYSL